jgi:hypothetical protein
MDSTSEYNVNLMANPAFRSYLRQTNATTGQVPQASTLQDIVSAELDKAHETAFKRKQMAYDQYKLKLQQEQMNRELAMKERLFQQQEEANSDAEWGQLGGGLTKLGVTALALYGNRLWNK